MDYGKKNLQKNKAKLSGEKHRKNRRFIHSFVKTVFVCFLLLMAVCAAAVAIYTNNLIAACPDVSTINISPSGFLTTIYDAEGNEMDTLAASGANREYVTLKEIPDDLEHAFVAIEDSRFYTHNGIDLKGIARAAFTGITSGGDSLQGASTITQQLLKNNYFTGWVNENTLKDKINRKIQEQYLAMQLEKVTSKDAILENYLNTINLGQNTLGVEAASERYFDKDVSELTLSESAVIAAITQNPSRYNPIRKPEENKKRRAKVLDNMLEQGFITQAQLDEALKDDVYNRIAIRNSEIENSTTSYFVDALCDQVISDLMTKLNYTESEANRKLYAGGLTIHATQVPSLQNICDEEVNNSENYPMEPKVSFSYRLTIKKADGSVENYSEQTMLSYYQSANSNYSIDFDSEEQAKEAIEAYKAEIMESGDTIPEGGETITFTLQPQVAMTVIDNSTGNVQALIGGRGEKIASRTLNRATGVTRQPGSTFKIIAAYAPALDAGGMTLATAIDDSPMTYANGRSLKNYDGSYRGWTPIRTGIIHSINVMAVKTLTEIGTDLGFKYAKDFGFTTLKDTDNSQALALGGLTYGVTNLELTGAYAAIANNGTYRRPNFYTTIEDYNGNVILDTSENERKEVIKPSTAWLLTSAMKDVMTSGTGVPANISNMTVAGKSGTTNEDRDTLFAGFSPYFTCCIWGGFDDNARQHTTAYSKAIWKSVMTRIHEGYEPTDFEMPDGITQVNFCSKSGKLALPNICENDPRGSMVRTEYFANGTAPKDSCDKHVQLTVCNESRLPAGPFCPAESVSTGVFIIGNPGTGDDEVLISPEALGQTCNIHTELVIKKEVIEETTEEVKKPKKKKKEQNKEEQNPDEPSEEEPLEEIQTESVE